jgi:glyoxylase-like metal-dependent hydrolase (beta-lactamase superfamily II)
MIDAPYYGRTGILSTYIVEGEKVTVIDPGPASQVPGVIEALDKLEIDEVSTIALTHIHLDHAAGCWVMLERYTNAKVHCHPRGVEHMVTPSKIMAAARETLGDTLKKYGEIRGIPKEKVHSSFDGERLILGGTELQVINTPGHSSHSQSYFEPKGKLLFAGDAAGYLPDNLGAVIPASPPPYNPVQATESLIRMESLAPKTLCVSHFGFYDGAVEWLRDFKRQVLLWERVVSKGFDLGRTLTEIYQAILDEDLEAQKLVSLDPKAESHIYSSLAGFMSYTNWINAKK